MQRPHPEAVIVVPPQAKKLQAGVLIPVAELVPVAEKAGQNAWRPGFAVNVAVGLRV